MSSELRDLYQEVILDHSKKPRNFRVLSPATHEAQGHNPLCGDRLTVYLHVVDDEVREVTFQGTGCAISTASASMMSESVRGKTLSEVETLFGKFHELLTGTAEPNLPCSVLGKLAAFSGVRQFPIRVKCATLPWHTLRAALEKRHQPVTTE